MTTTDLILLSETPWGELWGRNQQLVAGLLRQRADLRVLFVEPAAEPWGARLRDAHARRGRGLAPVSDVPGVLPAQLWRYQPTRWLPGRFEQLTDARITAGIRRAAARIGLVEPLLWIDDAQGASLLAETGWPALYDISSEPLAGNRPTVEEERSLANEEFLLREVQEVVVCSAELGRRKLAERHVTVIPNACDVELFSTPAPRPADLPTGPVVLYTGGVQAGRLDLELCALTARSVHDDGARMVLVGPARLAATERARLHAAGVLLLGSRPYREMPGYLQHADVLVGPYRPNAVTAGLDPIGLYEYQAAGRPIVTTPVARFPRSTEAVTVATGEGFTAAVRAALAEPAAHRVDPADVPSWNDRVRQLSAVVERLHTAPRPRARQATDAG